MADFQNYYPYYLDTGVSESLVTGIFDSVPDNATLVASVDESVTCTMVGDASWSNESDYRGRLIYKKGEPTVRVETLGPIPDGWFLEPPTQPINPDAEIKLQLAYLDFRFTRHYRKLHACIAYQYEIDKLAKLIADARPSGPGSLPRSKTCP
jgi:hypothetical protein